MSRAAITAIAISAFLCAASAAQKPASRAMVIVDEAATMREEPTPHGAIGSSTAYRISDGVTGRTMEFRKRILHSGSAIGLHRIGTTRSTMSYLAPARSLPAGLRKTCGLA